MDRIPNFICIGAQKAGTTSLFEILKQHSQICLPEVKEVHYFDKEDLFEKGSEWYSSNFKQPDKAIIGDITPDYIYFEKSASRIKELYKDSPLKIIAILRHPVDRAYSQYLMSKRRGFEALSFVEATQQEEQRLKNGDFEQNHFSYLDRGHYSIQLERYKEFIRDENMLVLSFENDIKSNLAHTIQRILAFLELDAEELNIDIQSNRATGARSKSIQKLIRGNYKLKPILKKLLGPVARKKLRKRAIAFNESKKIDNTKLSPSIRKELYDKYFSDEHVRLKELCNVDFNFWNEP